METSADSEPTRQRKWKRLILIPTFFGLLIGFLVSYAFPPRYTSQSAVLVEAQKIPSNYVQPTITAGFAERVQTLSLQAVSESRLRPVIHSLGLVNPEDEGKLMGDIRSNTEVTPMMTSMSQAASTTPTGAKKKPSPTDEPLPGFNVSYTDTNPARAQKICNALTSLILDENLKSRYEVAKGTTNFLGRQVEDAKRALDELDTRLSEMDKKGASRSKTLAIEYENAQAFYRDLLAKKSSADLGANIENQGEGEQMMILETANLPDSPDFPNRSLCALGGLGTGLILGIGLALWNKFRPPA